MVRALALGLLSAVGVRHAMAEADVPEGLARDVVHGEWLNERPSTHWFFDGGAIGIEGSQGSLWLSRQERVDRKWPDVGAPDNILLLDAPRQPTLAVDVSCAPQGDGAQAGLYLFANETNWVKLVFESSRDGSRAVIMAEQHAGQPFESGKLALTSSPQSIGLRLDVAEGRVRAKMRVGDGDWQPMTRGTSWLTPSEAREEGKDFGSLEPGDRRGEDAAMCQPPEGGRFAFVAEQWDQPAPVTFLPVGFSVVFDQILV